MKGSDADRGHATAWPTEDELLGLPAHVDDAQLQFLRMEYENLVATLLANEEAGERRVNVLVGLVVAVTAGLGLAADALGTETRLVAATAAVLTGLLLAFGLFTLRRVMKRNLDTTEIVNFLRVIRASHVLRDPSSVAVFPFVPEAKPKVRSASLGPGNGGILELVALANCALVGISIAAAGVAMTQPSADAPWAVIAIVAFVAIGVAGAWIAQMRWTQSVYAGETEARDGDRARAIEWWQRHAPEPGETFRAGVGIIVKRSDGRVLALERRDVPGAWQFPQGGLMRDETPEAAAWREMNEEVGLTYEHVTLEAVSDAWFGYELPEAYRKEKTGRGQVHRWFLFHLRDGIDTPPLPSGAGAEVRAIRWADPGEVSDGAAPFRQAEYRAALAWLESVAGAARDGRPADSRLGRLRGPRRPS